jgi:hypothetical protein
LLGSLVLVLERVLVPERAPELERERVLREPEPEPERVPEPQFRARQELPLAPLAPLAPQEPELVPQEPVLVPQEPELVPQERVQELVPQRVLARQWER